MTHEPGNGNGHGNGNGNGKAPTVKPFNYNAAAQWSVDIGAFDELDHALAELRLLCPGPMPNDEKRRTWRNFCEDK